MNNQEIYQAIARTMWSMMPEGAVEFEVYGKIYEDYSAYQEWLVGSDGARSQFGFDDAPVEPFYEILNQARKLRELEPFKREPWTHFKATLSEKGKFKMEFAYVPQDQDVISVYMRAGTAQELAEQQ